MSDPIDELVALGQAAPSPAVFERALAAVRKSVGADAVLLVRGGSSDITILAAASPSLEISTNLVRTATPLILAAPRGRMVTKAFTFRDRAVQMLAVPCSGEATWLMVWIRAEGDALERATQLVRLAAASLPHESEGGEETARAALALIRSFSEPRKARLAGFCERARKLLGCDSVFLSRHTLRGWTVPACDPPPLPASRSALHETLLLAFSNHASEPAAAVFPGPDAHPSLPEICRLVECGSCAVIPCGEGWAILAAWKSGEPPAPESLPSALAPLAPLLPSLHGHRRSLHHRWRALPFDRKRLWGIGAGAFIVLMVFPFHLRVHAPVILEPSLRRFVAAPFDSVLKKVHVEAGTVVEKGALLAELDGKEVRERIAEIEAQAAAANLQSASDLAGSRFDQSALSALQAQRAGHELEVLRQREKDLQILAPISGIVIQGELDREEGAALKLGRSIMEVAPLDMMVAEVALREEDAAFVHPGQKVVVRLNALPSADIRATVKKVNPRAETRDGRNIFIAEAEIANPAAAFRPGMKGDAVVVADRLPLFWILFRKPWNTLRSWLFW